MRRLGLALMGSVALAAMGPCPAAQAANEAPAPVTVRAASPQTIEVRAGERVELTLNFDVEAGLHKDIYVFVHFIAEDGSMARFQADHRPSPGTSRWRGAQQDRRSFVLPSDMPPGAYKIRVGLFDPAVQGEASRVPMTPAAGADKTAEPRAYDVGVLRVRPAANAPPRPDPTNAWNQGPRGGTSSADPLANASYTDDFARGLGYEKLTFHDEFSGPSLNAKAWVNTFAWGDRTLPANGEKQCYVERNVSQRDGMLVLTAKREPVTCPKHEKAFEFTSGMVASMSSFSQAYGYFAARIKIPSGRGLWPAFWLLPSAGGWPPEIDIMESPKSPPTQLFTTYHYLDDKGAHQTDGRETSGVDLSKDFHVYAVDWRPDEIRWFLDGVEIHSARRGVTDKPAYLLLNLAVGGNWPGDPDRTTPFPAEMQIDWVRVYAR